MRDGRRFEAAPLKTGIEPSTYFSGRKELSKAVLGDATCEAPLVLGSESIS